MAAGNDDSGRRTRKPRDKFLKLGLGAASVPVPPHWRVLRHDMAELSVESAEVVGGIFSIKLTSFEDPAAAAGDGVLAYLNFPEFQGNMFGNLEDVRGEDGRLDLERLKIYKGEAEGNSPGKLDFTHFVDEWRRAGVMPPAHVRVLEFRFRRPFKADEEGWLKFQRRLWSLVGRARFGKALTEFDLATPDDEGAPDSS